MEHTPSHEDHTDPTTEPASASDDSPTSDPTEQDDLIEQSATASVTTPVQPHDVDSVPGADSADAGADTHSDDEILAAAGMGPSAVPFDVSDPDGGAASESSASQRRGRYRRWRRPTEDRLVAGVAAAIADGAGLPLWFVRAGFAVAALFGGLGIAAYLGAWAILPSGDATHSLSDRWRQRWDAAERPSERAGLIVMAAAVLLAISATGVVAGPMTLAVVLALVGVAMLQPESI